MLENLADLVAEGYVTRRKHPNHDLWILNYTPKTQYDRFWNETTMSCRGLVVDGDGRVRARCFKKFFNLEEVRKEVKVRKGLGFQTFEKVDGSLGILYWIKDTPHIATRGSFTSKQALKATSILRDKYPNASLDPEVTLLFEIVYPSNRICVDYGNKEDIFLLAAFHTESGVELPPPSSPFPFTRSFNLGSDFELIKALNLKNKEGFVIRFEDGFRFKVKFEDYVALHSFIFSISTRSVWNLLRKGMNPIGLEVPNEINDWVKSVKESLMENYALAESAAAKVFNQIKHLDRKDFASVALQYDCSAVLFKMFDRKPYSYILWNMVEPEYETLRKNEEV